MVSKDLVDVTPQKKKNAGKFFVTVKNELEYQGKKNLLSLQSEKKITLETFFNKQSRVS